MKKSGVLHAELSAVIAALGHGQVLVVGDAGLPVPHGVRCVDLAVTKGVPSFVAVLRAILGEMHVERAEVAHETNQHSGVVATQLGELLGVIPTDFVTHEALKQHCDGAVAIVRTGEFTPYANVVLFAGVVF
jgi:D-ribose pyranase